MKELSPLAKVSFSTLIEMDDDLRQLRARYSAATTEEKIRAADFVYNSGLAQDIVGGGLLEFTRRPPGEGAIAALAIFPDFAPALLTVGSMEYQYARADEAMRYFLRLTTLSADTMDLVEIIDKAGSFLTDVPDFSRAERLYIAAVEEFPRNAVYLAAIGYFAGRGGRKDEAVAHYRKAAELDPSSTMLSDLGWSLVESGAYSEARDVLHRALAVDSSNVRARANLDYLKSLTGQRV